MLEVSHLTTVFDMPSGPVAAVDDVMAELQFQVEQAHVSSPKDSSLVVPRRSPDCSGRDVRITGSGARSSVFA